MLCRSRHLLDCVCSVCCVAIHVGSYKYRMTRKIIVLSCSQLWCDLSADLNVFISCIYKSHSEPDEDLSYPIPILKLCVVRFQLIAVCGHCNVVSIGAGV